MTLVPMPTVHASGFGFPEGPAYLPDGSVAFVDLLRQTIWRYADGETCALATVQGSPNGMRLGPDGALYIANNGGFAPDGLIVRPMSPEISGRIQRLSLDGVASDAAVDLPGEGPWRPNDLIFSPEGDLLFTDPGNWEAVKEFTPEGGYKGGRIFRQSRDGKLNCLTTLFGFTNGLALHPEGSLLVALTLPRKIVKLTFEGAGVSEAQDWCQFDTTMPDGIIFDGDRLYVAGSRSDTLAIVALDGTVAKVIQMEAGSDPTNLALGGGRLWVTLGAPGQLISYNLEEIRALAPGV